MQGNGGQDRKAVGAVGSLPEEEGPTDQIDPVLPCRRRDLSFLLDLLSLSGLAIDICLRYDQFDGSSLASVEVIARLCQLVEETAGS